MDKIKEYKFIILIVLVILGFAFYWYEFRPVQTRQECNKYATEMVNYDLKVFTGSFQGSNYDSQKEGDRYYKICLQEKGLD